MSSVWQNEVSSSALVRSNSGMTRLKASGEREIASPLAEQAAYLIDQRRSVAQQYSAHAVCRLDVLLLDRFDRHKAHRGSTGSLDNRLRIVAIVLVRLDERCDILRADQSDFDTDRLETSRPVVGSAACFHDDHFGIQRAHGIDQRTARDLRPMYDTAATISAVELEDLLREIDAENVDFHDEPPHVWVSALVPPAGRRRVHLSKIWRFVSNSRLKSDACLTVDIVEACPFDAKSGVLATHRVASMYAVRRIWIPG